jgi:phosphatidylglycerol lysyltransferase
MNKSFAVKLWQPQQLTALVVATAGIVSLSHLHIHRTIQHTDGLIRLSIDIVHASRIVSIVIGLLLLYLSTQLLRKKIRAWQISCVGLVGLLAIDTLHGDYGRALLYAATLLILWTWRKTFVVRSDNYNLRRGILISLAILTATTLYGAIGFYFLERRDFGIDFGVLDSLKYSFLQITLQPTDVLTPNTRYADLFLDSLHALGITGLVLVASSLFKPVRFVLSLSQQSRQKARIIIKRHSTSTEDFFKLYPEDKHYFFSKAGTSVVAYGVSRGVALVVDGPNGPQQSAVSTIVEFSDFIERQGWTPAIVHADQELSRHITHNGYDSIYIGSEAIVDVKSFASTTHRSKHFRYIHNKAHAEGLDVEFWQAPLEPQQVASLRSISDQWLASGRKEYTFVMAPFSDEYLASCDVAVLKQHDDYVAYANILPSFVDDSRSIDHIRHAAAMPSVGMHYLLKELILRLSQQGITSFNLGLAPLSRLESLETPNLSEKLLSTIKEIGSRFYSFKGLEQFKNKFEPDWQARYICYRGSPAQVLRISSALSSAMTVSRSSRPKYQRLNYSLAIVAAISYVSFPLGYILGLSSNGLVSELGAQGAAYANIFNTLDVLSGISIIAICLAMASSLTIPRQKLALLAYGLAGLGGMTAAICTLPGQGTLDLTASASVLHVVASAINAGGIIVAAAVCSYLAKSSRTLRIIFLMYIAVSLLSLIFVGNDLGFALQRLQIVLTGVWIILIPLVVPKLKS